jgi:thiol-disulfide isomerase/thioredoxin
MTNRLSAIAHRRRRATVRLAWQVLAASAVLSAAPLLSIPGSPFPASTVSAQETGLPVGSKAPGAAVETLDGKPFDIGQYIGKTPVLIEFWATWCPNCKQLEPAMTAAAKKYAGKMRFVAVAVSVNQSPERVKLYKEKHGMPMEIYFDSKGAAADAYDAAATSYIVVVDKNGTVVYTGLGGTQNLEAAIQKGLAG